jgi:hypothetical protein
MTLRAEEKMQKSIDPILAKVVRIKKQYESFSSEIKKWSETKCLVTECTFKENRLGYDLNIKSFTEPYQLEQLGIELGEIIHNLRSCLDNLAYALACLKCDPPKNPRMIYFPIFEKKDDFVNNYCKMREIFHEEVFKKLELIQPFQRDGALGNGNPKDDPLLLLSSLSNTDKHRKPTIVFLSPKEIKWSGSVEYFRDEDCQNESPPNATIYVGPLMVGATIMDYKTTFPIKSVNGSFEYQIQIEIEYMGLRYQLFETLEKLFWYLGLVVEYFLTFFI